MRVLPIPSDMGNPGFRSCVLHASPLLFVGGCRHGSPLLPYVYFAGRGVLLLVLGCATPLRCTPIGCSLASFCRLLTTPPPPPPYWFVCPFCFLVLLRCAFVSGVGPLRRAGDCAGALFIVVEVLRRAVPVLGAPPWSRVLCRRLAHHHGGAYCADVLPAAIVGPVVLVLGPPP